MDPLRLVFAGTPAFAAQHLQALLEHGHQVCAVYTQPDRAAGRGKKLQPSPVKMLALEYGIEVRQPLSLRADEEQLALAALKADLMIVVAYGLILPASILNTPAHGCINVHASLLPRWRGAAPIERAILAGDEETGVTIMQMDEGLDTGRMLYKRSTPISAEDNRLTLENRLSLLGSEALLHTLAEFDSLRVSAEAQDEQLSTYARKIEKSEALIDWTQSAEFINRQIRAGIGRNPAYTTIKGERIRLLKARATQGASAQTPGTLIATEDGALRIHCGDSVLEVTEVQLPGKSPVAVRDALNSRREFFTPGLVFGADDTRS